MLVVTRKVPIYLFFVYKREHLGGFGLSVTLLLVFVVMC